MNHNKSHPLTVFRTLKPLLFVLLVPVAQQIFRDLAHRTVRPIWRTELLLAALAIVVAILRWRAEAVEWDERSVIFRRGFFFRQTAVVPREKLVAAVFSQNPADILLGAVTLTFQTEGGRTRRSDFTYKLYQKDVKTLYLAVFGKEIHPIIAPKFQRCLWTAAAESSALTGWTVAVPVIRRAGKLFGVALSQMLLWRLRSATVRFQAYFPRALNVLTLLLLAGYTVSFLVALVRLARFRLSQGQIITISAGLFIRRKVVAFRDLVSAVVLEQPPLLRALRRFLPRISAGALGVARRETPSFFPMDSHANAVRQTQSIFAFSPPDGIFLRPPQTRQIARRFYRLPVIWLAVVLTAAVLAGELLAFFNRFAVFLTLPLLVTVAYYGHLCRFNFRHGGIVFGKTVFARNSRGRKTREWYCSAQAVANIYWRETPRDRRDGTCNFRITLNNRAAENILVRRLDRKILREHLENWLHQE